MGPYIFFFFFFPYFKIIVMMERNNSKETNGAIGRESSGGSKNVLRSLRSIGSVEGEKIENVENGMVGKKIRGNIASNSKPMINSGGRRNGLKQTGKQFGSVLDFWQALEKEEKEKINIEVEKEIKSGLVASSSVKSLRGNNNNNNNNNNNPC